MQYLGRFTVEQLQQAVDAARQQLNQRADDGFLRSEEWQDMLQLGRDSWRRLLRRLLDDKVLERGRVMHESTDGVVRPVAAYRLRQTQADITNA